MKLNIDELRVNYHADEQLWVIVYVEKGAPLMFFKSISEAVDAMSAVQLGYMELTFDLDAFESEQSDIEIAEYPVEEGADV